jgi:hypothetical protein
VSEPWYARAWAWLRRWWAGLVAGVVLLLAVAGVVRRRQLELGKARDEAAVAEARRRMDELRARRVEVHARVDEKSEEITTLDAQILESKRQIVALHEGGDKIPDKQLDDAFAQLGY